LRPSCAGLLARLAPQRTHTSGEYLAVLPPRRRPQRPRLTFFRRSV
jgi:hypothetical protein